eukprot:595635-Amphidinium_carterae.1
MYEVPGSVDCGDANSALLGAFAAPCPEAALQKSRHLVQVSSDRADALDEVVDGLILCGKLWWRWWLGVVDLSVRVWFGCVATMAPMAAGAAGAALSAGCLGWAWFSDASICFIVRSLCRQDPGVDVGELGDKHVHGQRYLI